MPELIQVFLKTMGRRKTEKKLIRSLTKTSQGRSYSITLPIEVIRKWHWKERQKLQLKIDNKRKRIIIEDWRKKKSEK